MLRSLGTTVLLLAGALTMAIPPVRAQPTAAPGEPLPAPAAAQADPKPTELAELKEKKELIEAQTALLKAQNALIKEQFPQLEDSFGKKGALSIGTADRDKFHVTARSAESFQTVATLLAAKIEAARTKQQKKTVLVLTDTDRTAAASYLAAQRTALTLVNRTRQSLGQPEVQPQAVGATVFAVGTALSQLAGFTKAFRADRDIAFTDSLLPEELLVDLLVVSLGDTARYPAGEADRLLAADYTSGFLDLLKLLLDARAALVAKGDATKDLVTAIDQELTRLAAIDATTKLPALLTVLRGEKVSLALAAADAVSVTVSIASKGGVSMKTSNFFRSDRLYASGGLIVSYRIATTGKDSKLVDADVLVSESGLVEIPLR